MATTFEIKSWLAELGIQGDDLALMETKLSPHAAKIGEGVMRQADYSRAMNDVQALQTELTTKNARLDAEAAEWGQLTAAERAANTELRQQMEQTRNEAAVLRNRITTVAAEHGLDAAKLLEGVPAGAAPAAPTAPAGAPAVDTTKFVSIESHQGLAAMALRLPAQLAKIAREHRALTSTDVDETAIIAEIERRATTRGNTKSLDPQQVWEEMHDIPAKRAAAAQADLDSKLAAAREEGRQAGLSAASLPTGGGRQPQHAIALTTGRGLGQGGSSILQRPQPGSSVAGAVSAFDSGKYRQKSA